METPKWKSLIGKGAFVVVCILVALLLLAGAIYGTYRVQRCANSRQTNGTPEPTATPEPTPLPNRLYPAEKHIAVAPPLDKLDLSDAHAEDYGEILQNPERWLDLTPEGAEGFTVIRSIDLGCSYVCEDGAYYRLGEGTDGKGVLDVILCDFDWDDTPDLLYTYHFGTNEDRCSKVGWFDFDTHASMLSDFQLQDGFFALAEENGAYVLYRADRDADLDTGTFSLTFTQRIGTLIESQERLILLME
jgi:hypothetical protein